ncbi:hypothetical protein [Nesterenkonia alkaliphila]|uniref:Uncharacterized protein n=1 Tax=Nesterenkonia alkaliphila TaxID=1463631 RepID=A0A7K1UH22_9MICC|nr:hypothetical protein [Nesterenkonia alkaliphila]MVT25686.1 hypothetical protein [Nesterenkonia alkaliphila]GFZ85097.1 hypothetical protein GCM10011359_12720 [Nesterenkonia alkaliphila]
MTERPEGQSPEPDQPEEHPEAAGDAAPQGLPGEKYTGPTGYIHARGEDIPEDIQRTPNGGLPVTIIVIAAALFILGFWLFRRWRGQYVDYGNIGGASDGAAGALQPLATVLGLG